MANVLVRWLCHLYRTLLFAYPPNFRRQYASEMTQFFGDRCRAVVRTRGLAGLVGLGVHTAADWLVTTVYEGIAYMRATPPSAGATSHAFDGVPVFYTCGHESPRPSALINGGVLSIAVFALISFLIGHGGTQRFWLIGSHHPSRSHLLPAATSAVPKTDLDAEVKVKPQPDEPPVSPYFKMLPVLGVLDANRDGIISASEIANAPAALRKLDKNGDGALSPEECGLNLAGSPADSPGADEFARRARLGFMRLHPVLAALDANHDGEISTREIKNAAAALRTLDQNGDRQLTIDELLPDPVINQVTGLMLALDKNGDGKISTEERSTALGGKFRAILDSADIDKDGSVTEEELTNEMRRRAKLAK
jgi:Ca2+-binding EF-hand superfamily protein